MVNSVEVPRQELRKKEDARTGACWGLHSLAWLRSNAGGFRIMYAECTFFVVEFGSRFDTHGALELSPAGASKWREIQNASDIDAYVIICLYFPWLWKAPDIGYTTPLAAIQLQLLAFTITTENGFF